MDSFQDIFKKSFLAANTAIDSLAMPEIILNLSMSLIMGLAIFFTYKKTFQGVLYQRSFNASLIAITIILTFIIMIIKGNLVLSLGMVGALSIVRFRTPIKDPMDLVFVFWAIAIGIANGVGLFHVSIIASLFVAITLFIAFKFKEENSSYLLILHLNNAKKEEEIIAKVQEAVSHYKLKSKAINPDFLEIIAEVRLKNNDGNFINDFNQKSGVNKATLITSNDSLSSI